MDTDCQDAYIRIMSHCRILDVIDHNDETLRVRGQYRRDEFHFDGRLKRIGAEYASEWLWYPTEDMYQRFRKRVAEIDQMTPTET